MPRVDLPSWTSMFAQSPEHPIRRQRSERMLDVEFCLIPFVQIFFPEFMKSISIESMWIGIKSTIMVHRITNHRDGRSIRKRDPIRKIEAFWIHYLPHHGNYQIKGPLSRRIRKTLCLLPLRLEYLTDSCTKLSILYNFEIALFDHPSDSVTSCASALRGSMYSGRVARSNNTCVMIYSRGSHDHQLLVSAPG